MLFLDRSRLSTRAVTEAAEFAQVFKQKFDVTYLSLRLHFTIREFGSLDAEVKQQEAASCNQASALESLHSELSAFTFNIRLV